MSDKVLDSQLDILTNNMAAMLSMIQTLNDVVLVLLHNHPELEIPEWKDIEEVNAELSDTIKNCVAAIRKAGKEKKDGPVKTDKS